MKTKNMHIIDNKLYIGKFSLEELANEYSTPLYVYDEVGIRDKMNTFKENFKSNRFDCKVVYATKAFLAPRLVRMLMEYDFYADGVSLGDMYLLEKSGFDLKALILHGNNKSDEELITAVNKNVGVIVVDNLGELKRLESIASSLKKEVSTLVRINPGIEAHTHAYIETSLLDSKFGESIYDLAILEKIFNIYKKSKYLKLNGFHAHIGSQIVDGNSFKQLAKKMCSFYKEVQDKYGFELGLLNLGGGFGIKYLDKDTEIDLQVVLKEIIKVVEDEFEMCNNKIKTLMIEPGRSIVGDSGVTLYKVGDTKKTYAGVEYAFVDGGLADNIRPALYDALYSVDVVNRMQSENKKKISIVGKCCESGDIIRKNIEMSEVKPQDIVCVYSTGAYCYSMSMNYNGLVKPAVIFVNNEKVHTVIKRQSLENLISTCVFEEENNE